MFAPFVTIALILAPFAFAQDNTLGIEAIEAHFTQSDLVPDLFPSFDPSALLTVNFTGVGVLQPGQGLTEAQVAPSPVVQVFPANSSISLNGTYTLAMIDADIPGAKLPNGQTRHWLVNGVTISGNNIVNSSAVAITSYAGPAPAAGSGPHRYVVLLYNQPSTFTPPEGLSQPGVPVQTFVWSDYVQQSNLGPLEAATYFTVEEGTATVSLLATSSVVTSTLPAASSTTKGTSTTNAPGSPSQTHSGAARASIKIMPVAAALVMIFMM